MLLEALEGALRGLPKAATCARRGGKSDALLAVGTDRGSCLHGWCAGGKTDDLKPADPDTGESTVEEATLGLLPNPFEKQGVKFAVTYIGEGLGNPTGGTKQGAAYEHRINFAADVDLRSCSV
jgi:hypothetical protein